MGALPCSLARAYLYGLTIDPRTHVYAALAGQSFVGTQGDLAAILLAQAVLNMGRKENEKPVRLPSPYSGAGKKAQREAVPKREKVALTERLTAFSSIPD